MFTGYVYVDEDGKFRPLLLYNMCERVKIANEIIAEILEEERSKE